MNGLYFTANLSIILTKLTSVTMHGHIVLVYFCGQSLGTYIYMRATKCLTIVVPTLRLVYNMCVHDILFNAGNMEIHANMEIHVGEGIPSIFKTHGQVCEQEPGLSCGWTCCRPEIVHFSSMLFSFITVLVKKKVAKHFAKAREEHVLTKRSCYLRTNVHKVHEMHTTTVAVRMRIGIYTVRELRDNTVAMGLRFCLHEVVAKNRDQFATFF